MYQHLGQPNKEGIVPIHSDVVDHNRLSKPIDPHIDDLNRLPLDIAKRVVEFQIACFRAPVPDNP